MGRDVRHILWAVLLLGFTSMIYFLSLPAHLPIWVTLLLIVAYGFLSARWMARHIPAAAAPAMTRGDMAKAYLVFFAGLAFMVKRGYRVEQEFGHWDAWWLWDHHAKYLQDSAYWRELFKLNDPYHPDYPLFLSSVIAFVWRLMGSFDKVVPFTFSMLVALWSPCVIFLSLYRRNLLVASVAFLLLAFHTEYLTMALALYADQPLAFLFLFAFVCMELVPTNRNMVPVVMALLGCCIWMKNEGMMLALVFVAFHARALLGNGNAKRALIGIALPLCVYALLKLNAPANDLVKGQGAMTLERLLDGKRYVQIWSFFYKILSGPMLPFSLVMFIYLLYCYVVGRSPGRNMLLLFTCILGFSFVYVLTPQDLSWHLSTSADRVLYQLLPSFIYVMARNFCNLRLVADAEQFQ